MPHEIIPPQQVEDAASLTDYAVMSRYPGDFESVDEEEYTEAVELAKTVLLWAETIIRQARK